MADAFGGRKIKLMDPSRLVEIGKTFHRMDTDHNELLGLGEIYAALENLELDQDVREILQISVTYMELSNDGFINFVEFQRALRLGSVQWQMQQQETVAINKKISVLKKATQNSPKIARAQPVNEDDPQKLQVEIMVLKRMLNDNQKELDQLRDQVQPPRPRNSLNAPLPPAAITSGAPTIITSGLGPVGIVRPGHELEDWTRIRDEALGLWKLVEESKYILQAIPWPAGRNPAGKP